MKTTYKLSFLIFISSCSYNSDKQTDSISSRDSLIKSETIVINGQRLIQTTNNERFTSLTTSSGDTIVKAADFYLSAEFIDMNEDGEKDLRVHVISNTPNQCENYFFDTNQKLFRHINQSDLDIKSIPGTNYFYSYNSTGCSDLSWESQLVTIQDWNEIPIGLMKFKGCGDKYDGIDIYKVAADSLTLIKSLPVKSFDNNGENNKWAFIRVYWTENYQSFVK